MATKQTNREHDFTLVLAGIPDLTEDVENALFEAGCGDGTISFRSGRIFVTFSRQAASLKDAVISAIGDVQKANIGADIIRVDPCTLVTQSDIARRIQRSRQMVHQYITGRRGPGNFPPPACEISETAPLWYWCEVARWLWENDMIQEEVLREAEDLAAINGVLEMRWLKQLAPDVMEEVVNFFRETDCPTCRQPALV